MGKKAIIIVFFSLLLLFIIKNCQAWNCLLADFLPIRRFHRCKVQGQRNRYRIHCPMPFSLHRLRHKSPFQPVVGRRPAVCHNVCWPLPGKWQFGRIFWPHLFHNSTRNEQVDLEAQWRKWVLRSQGPICSFDWHLWMVWRRNCREEAAGEVVPEVDNNPPQFLAHMSQDGPIELLGHLHRGRRKEGFDLNRIHRYSAFCIRNNNIHCIGRRIDCNCPDVDDADGSRKCQPFCRVDRMPRQNWSFLVEYLGWKWSTMKMEWLFRYMVRLKGKKWMGHLDWPGLGPFGIQHRRHFLFRWHKMLFRPRNPLHRLRHFPPHFLLSNAVSAWRMSRPTLPVSPSCQVGIPSLYPIVVV